MENWKFKFLEKDSKELVEVLMEEYHKGMEPLKNISLLGIIDKEFFDEFGETDKKFKITIEVK